MSICRCYWVITFLVLYVNYDKLNHKKSEPWMKWNSVVICMVLWRPWRRDGDNCKAQRVRNLNLESNGKKRGKRIYSWFSVKTIIKKSTSLTLLQFSYVLNLLNFWQHTWNSAFRVNIDTEEKHRKALERLELRPLQRKCHRVPFPSLKS